MTLLGGVQRRDLPGQVVIPRSRGELVHAHRHTPERRCLRGRSGRPEVVPACIGCVEQRILDRQGYAKLTVCRGDR